MLRKLIRGVGRFLLFLAKMALYLGAILFLTGASILALPLYKLSPQRRKMEAGMQFATAGIALLSAYADEQRPIAEPEPEPELTVTVVEVDEALDAVRGLNPVDMIGYLRDRLVHGVTFDTDDDDATDS